MIHLLALLRKVCKINSLSCTCSMFTWVCVAATFDDQILKGEMF